MSDCSETFGCVAIVRACGCLLLGWLEADHYLRFRVDILDLGARYYCIIIIRCHNAETVCWILLEEYFCGVLIRGPVLLLLLNELCEGVWEELVTRSDERVR